MRDSLRFLAVPLAMVIGTSVCFDVLAQQGRPTRPGVNPQPAQPQVQQQQRQVPGRPDTPGHNRIGPEQIAPQAPPDAPIDPELESFLKQWEQRSSQIKTITGLHDRFVYNLVFEVEERSTGKFYLETPDKGRIDLVPTDIPKGTQSKRIGTTSKRPFRLEAGHGERWICSGQEIIAIDDDAKSYQIMPLPKEVQGQNIVHSPLPFLFGMKAEEAKTRYNIELRKNTKDEALLIIFPKLESDRQNYSKATVMLEKVNYLPTAVQLLDPSSNLETVYVFRSVKVNKTPHFWEIFNDTKPFNPDLKKYTLSLTETEGPANTRPQNTNARPVQSNATRPNAPAGNQPPPRTGTAIRPTSNK